MPTPRATEDVIAIRIAVRATVQLVIGSITAPFRLSPIQLFRAQNTLGLVTLQYIMLKKSNWAHVGKRLGRRFIPRALS